MYLISVTVCTEYRSNSSADVITHGGGIYEPVVPAAASRGRCPRPRQFCEFRHSLPLYQEERSFSFHSCSELWEMMRWGWEEETLFISSQVWFVCRRSLFCYKHMLKLQCKSYLHFSVPDTDKKWKIRCDNMHIRTTETSAMTSRTYFMRRRTPEIIPNSSSGMTTTFTWTCQTTSLTTASFSQTL